MYSVAVGAASGKPGLRNSAVEGSWRWRSKITCSNLAGSVAPLQQLLDGHHVFNLNGARSGSPRRGVGGNQPLAEAIGRRWGSWSRRSHPQQGMAGDRGEERR